MSIIRFLGALSLSLALSLSAGPILVQNGQSVAFLGDSITAQGAATPGGYVNLVASGLEANGVKITVIPAGVSGNKSNQMLDRLPDILAKKPDWLTLSCGVNDVWHGERGVPLDAYKVNITAIVDQCQKAGVKVVILTATQIKLPVDNPLNLKLVGYNAFLRDLAKQRGLPLADLNAAMLAEQQSLRAAGVNRDLTVDGVHMNIYGNLMMAKGVLSALGLDDGQIAAASASWLDIPDTYQTGFKLKLSLRDFAKLDALAATRKMSAQALANEIAQKALDNAIQSAPSK